MTRPERPVRRDLAGRKEWLGACPPHRILHLPQASAHRDLNAKARPVIMQGGPVRRRPGNRAGRGA